MVKVGGIDDELIKFCHWLIDKRDMPTASRLNPIADDLTQLVAELSVKRK